MASLFRSSCVVAAALLAGLPAVAQSVLPPATVTGRAEPPLAIGGWDGVPLARTPLQASVLSEERMRDAGVTRLSDLARIDPSAGDAYNAEGYWDSLTVRGFVIDNRYNYRRDGLPINAETSIPLDNKERIELLRGLSGLQAGTSAPGGLVNLVVKRPLATPLRSATLGWRESGSWLGAVDLNQRVGEAIGIRLNAAYEHLDPAQRSARGHRRIVAAAAAWQASRDLLVEAEFETSHRSQPSVPGFSLLGATLPDARSVDPRVNLNNQSWTQPVVLNADTASLRLTQRLAADWTLMAQLATQRLHSDDRIAFPFGCSAEGNFDRFCSDGSFDLYQFISDGERRRSDAIDVSLAGVLRVGGLEHRVQGGLLRSTFSARFGTQVFDFAGIGRIDGSVATPPSAGTIDQNTDRDETSTELYLHDALRLSERNTLWLGVRHTRLERRSVGTDGTEPTAFEQSLSVPWLALSHDLSPDTMAYASWGRGIEADVAPNRPTYANAGQPLPALKSRQFEVGLKSSGAVLDWGVALFDIERPLYSDVGACDADVDADASCVRQIDGVQQHRGIELAVGWRAGAWTLDGAAMLLRARREDGVDPALNGLRPTNVAARSIKALVGYAPASLPGLTLLGGLVHEGDRIAVPDNSAGVGGWTRLDAALRYRQRAGESAALTWRLGIDNIADRRAWKEAPYQFSHAYLFPLAPRTWRLSVQAEL